MIDKDAPRPLGKSVITTSYADANLLHDLITERSVPASFMNWTPPVEELPKGSDKISVDSDRMKDGRITDGKDGQTTSLD